MLSSPYHSEAPGSLAAKPFATVRLADLDPEHLVRLEKCQPQPTGAVLCCLVRALELKELERSLRPFVGSTW